MQLPDYGGGSIVNLMASLQMGMGGSEHPYPTCRLLSPDRVRAHRRVLLLIIDGLGLNYLRAHPEAACLNARLEGGLTSVYPPTTASAITTYLTGDAPQQHGLTGWHMYFAELGSVLAVLPGRSRYGGVGLTQAGIDPARLFGHTPFADRIGIESYNLSPGYIAESDFNRAHLGCARSRAYGSLQDLMDQAANLLTRDGRRFVYGYWPELDSLGHRYGIWSDQARAHLLELDRAIEDLFDRVQGSDCLVVVCADHGQIDTTSADRVCLDDHPRLAETLAMPLCGEPRSTYCYLRPGFEAQFDAYVTAELSGIVEAYASSDLIEAGWFGMGEAHPQLQRRIGDRVLLAQGHYLLKDWLPQEPRHELIGVHGGLSEDELRVPCILSKA
jgi:hypothetical protein